MSSRTALIQQYVVLHLKTIELLHIWGLIIHLSRTAKAPDNMMGHGVDSFKETLLGVSVTIFMAICDKTTSTNARHIWCRLHPECEEDINRVWEKHIHPGEIVMKAYRDQAGAHGDHFDKYLEGKLGLSIGSKAVIEALDAFCGLAMRLMNRQATDAPDLASEIEAALLDAELGMPNVSFNRRWLRRMHLIESGPYRKFF